MVNRHGDRRTGRRWWWIVALIAAAVVVAIVVGIRAHTPGKSGDATASAEQAAQQRCESDVMKRLVSPDKSTLSDVRTATGTLDVDARDFSALNASDSLKGVDTARITVLNVSGVVNVPSEVNTVIQDHFDCRAYFVDGGLAHTVVIFDHAH